MELLPLGHLTPNSNKKPRSRASEFALRLEIQNSPCSTAFIFFTHALNNKLDRVKFGLDECDAKIERQIEAKQTGREVSHRSVR